MTNSIHSDALFRKYLESSVQPESLWIRGETKLAVSKLPSFLIVYKHSSADSSALSRKCSLSDLLFLSDRLFLSQGKRVKIKSGRIWIQRLCSVTASSYTISHVRQPIRELNSLLSICHRDIIATFTLKWFINCVLITPFTSGRVSIDEWSHVWGPNSTWRRKCCWFTLNARLNINENSDTDVFKKKYSNHSHLETWMHQMYRNTGIQGQELT